MPSSPTGEAMRQTTVARLFDDNLERLRLRHICGSLATRISVSEDRIWPADMVGHLNLIHPDRLQILGTSEIAWARRQTREKVIHHVREILSFAPPALIVADDEDIPSIIRTLCANEDVALFASPLPAANIIDHLRNNYIVVSLYVDEKVRLFPENDFAYLLDPKTGEKLRTVGSKWGAFQVNNFDVSAQPYYVLMHNDGKTLLNKPTDYPNGHDPAVYKAFLDCGYDAFQRLKNGQEKELIGAR